MWFRRGGFRRQTTWIRSLCGNVRGLNSQQKQRDVKMVINSQRVGLVGLLETKVKAPKMGELYLSLFKVWCFTSNSS